MIDTLFEMPKADVPKIDVLPVSVVEIEKQTSERRDRGGHDKNSSRQQYSHFPAEVSSLCLDLYLRNSTRIFDPFAGWGERHCAVVKLGKQYTGFDINPEAISDALKIYGVKNILCNSLYAKFPCFDGLLTCPPYWNLEKYNDNGIDSLNSWSEFIKEYGHILSRCCKEGEANAVCCIMVGDWRKNNVYYDLTYQTRKIMENNNATVIDEVIISRRNISKIKIMLPQAKRLGYTVKLHETLLIYKLRGTR